MEMNLLRESIPPNLYPELFHRHGANPILTARDWPYLRTCCAPRTRKRAEMTLQD